MEKSKKVKKSQFFICGKWVKKIDPSPFQIRKHFDEDKLKELAATIRCEGLIEPIVVRLNGGRYELIAGESRLRAIRDYTEIKAIAAQVVKASDLQARRISAAENLQREELSAIETIEGNVEMVDAELIEDKEYASMGKKPADRVKALLGKLHSISISKKRGSKASKKADLLFNKFIKQVEKIFKNRNFSKSPGNSYWIPAFAGMTAGCECLSFPRKRESRKC